MITLQDIPENYLKKIEIYIQDISKTLNIDFQHEDFDKIIKLYQLFIIELFYFTNNHKNDKKLLKKIDSLSIKKNTLSNYIINTLPFYYKHYCKAENQIYYPAKIADTFLSIFVNIRKYNGYHNTYDIPSSNFSNILFYIELFKEHKEILHTFFVHFVFNNKNDFLFIKNIFLEQQHKESFLKEYITLLLRSIQFSKINPYLFNVLFNSLNDFDFDNEAKTHYTNLIIKDYIEKTSITEDIVLFLNKKFNKNYIFENVKELSQIRTQLVIEMYNFETDSFLHNLDNLLEYSNNFLAFKEKLFLERSLRDF